MIGSGVKQLAKEHGMKVASGVAYGSLGVYAILRKAGREVADIKVTELN